LKIEIEIHIENQMCLFDSERCIIWCFYW